ncbi:MAG: hypothetical protein K5662_01545 [Lachnospiraceae bacterium]|nr:hypothetical protein [Lachnospiraceae bacterium]
MLEIIVSWFVITIITYSIGYSVLRLPAVINRRVRLERFFLPSMLAGMMVCNVYAEVYSLFDGVGMLAFVIMSTIAIILLFINRRRIKEDLSTAFSEAHPVSVILRIILILLISFCSSTGYMHFDTGLYHAQAIRWIEEYGVVPGLANLELRFGYNSSEFALNALFGFKWLLGRSLHTTGGYLLMVSCMIAMGVGNAFKRIAFGAKDKKIDIRLSDLVRIGLIFYICTILGEIVSPASDYYALLLVFDIVILWLDATYLHDELVISEAELMAMYTFLSVLILYTITIKLSAGLLVILAVEPALMLIRHKKVKGILMGVGSGLIVLIPHLIRNVIISGWMLYPAVFPDIFSVDWKVPKGDAQFDAVEIGLYGRGITDMSHMYDPITQWFGNWFGALKMLEKVWVIGSAVAVVAGLILLVVLLINAIRLKKDGERDLPSLMILPEYSVVFVTIASCVIFWFRSAPLVRYGYAYLIILPILVFGYVFILIRELIAEYSERLKKITGLLAAAVVMLFLLSKAYDIIVLVGSEVDNGTLLTQMDYPNGAAECYDVDGQNIYIAVDRGQIGYYKFPATSLIRDDLHLRGDSLEDGFTRNKIRD